MAHPRSKMATRGDGHVSISEQSPLCQLLGFGPVSLWVSVSLLRRADGPGPGQKGLPAGALLRGRAGAQGQRVLPSEL